MTTMRAASSMNPYLLPTPLSKRTSSAWEIASLWIGLVVGLPSYYIAGTLVEKGMTSFQGLIVVVAAKTILLFPLLLQSQPGTHYGLPFPILARSTFGVRGAHVPSLLRALVACGWFGIETWFGGQAIYILFPEYLRNTEPIPWVEISAPELLCYFIFWLVQLVTLWKGMSGIRVVERYASPILVALSFLLLSWAYVKAGGFGPMLDRPSTLSPAEFWSLFLPSLTANVGSWAPMALSIPDFTRYARTQRDQVLGQVGLPLFMGSFAFVGLAVTSSTEVIFGKTISNPIRLLAEISSPLAKALAVPGIILAIITTNIPANIVAPANAFVSLSPSRCSFQGGAFVTAVIGAVLFQPWRIVNSPDRFVYTWLVGYSSAMGPLAGVMLADYYILRGGVIDVEELYSTSPEGAYYYWRGYNLAAMASLVVSMAPAVPGFMQKLEMVEGVGEGWVFVYNVGWFFGFLCSGVVYLVLCYFVELFFGGEKQAKVRISLDGDLKDALAPRGYCVP